MSGFSSSQRGAAFDEELEELGDEAIIAQEQRAHVPAARAAVKEERESVVISEYPPPRSERRRSGRHGRGDATVVIRDKRRIHAMRQALVDSQRPSPPDRRVLLWAGAALGAFLLGGVAAVIAARASASSTLPAIPSSTVHVTSAPPRAESVEAESEAAPSPAPKRASPKAAGTGTPAAISLEDLPVERPTKR